MKIRRGARHHAQRRRLEFATRSDVLDPFLVVGRQRVAGGAAGFPDEQRVPAAGRFGRAGGRRTIGLQQRIVRIRQRTDVRDQRVERLL